MIIMINEIFEMIIREARDRPGDNYREKAFAVIDELNDRVNSAFNRGLEKELKSYSKYGETP